MADAEAVISPPQPLGADVTLVEVRGEVTFASADALDRSLAAGLATGRRRLVVDISGVPFIDSSGIAVLLRASTAAGREGCSMVVVHGGDEPPGIFRLPGVERLLRLYPSREAAVAG